jgi:hypothetical protein
MNRLHEPPNPPPMGGAKPVDYEGNDAMLVAFVYVLLRQEVQAGRVEQIVEDIEKAHTGDPKITFTNGYLLGYATNIVDRLTK